MCFNWVDMYFACVRQQSIAHDLFSHNHTGAVGPYRQSERLEIYKRVAQQLLDSGDAYPCFCTEAELEEKRKQVSHHPHPVDFEPFSVSKHLAEAY